MDYSARLKSILEGETLSDTPTLKEYSQDASLFEIKPSLVVAPRHLDDLRRLIQFAASERNKGEDISLTPRAAGSDMSGGPLSASVVVNMLPYFNHIKEVGADYAIAEPGVYYRDFEKATLAKNLLLPCYPASRELCTIGGMVSNNSGGEKTLAYGKTENYVREMKVVLADGNEYVFKPLNEKELSDKMRQDNFEGGIYRAMDELIIQNARLLARARPKVSKNSAGYSLWNVWNKKEKTFDLTKLLVGSQGTLGIITEVNLRLIQPKSHSRLLVIFVNDKKLLAQISSAVLAYNPESFESYDDNTFRLALKFFPDFLKITGGNIFSLALKFLPEFWLMLTGGIPKMVLLAGFTADTPEAALEKTQKADQALKKFKVTSKVTKNEEATRKYWLMRRESFNLLRHHIRGRRTAPFIDDVIVQSEKLTEFLPRLNQILSQYNILYTVAGHIGNGNFHIIPLMNLAEPETKKIIEELSTKVYDLVKKFSGSITAEHNDGLIRTPFLRQMYGEKVYRLFEETKKIFDPQNIFNPGKKVGTDLQTALKYLRTKN